MQAIETQGQTAASLKQFTDNWIWRSVHSLIETPNFNPSPRWIAEKLNISIEKAVDALEGLEKLGLILKAENTYKVTSDWLQVMPQDLSRTELLDTHIKIAPQILSRLNEDDGFTVQFFNGNKELLKKYGSKFIELYKQMDLEAKQLGITEIMASEISFVQLTKEIGGVQ